LMKRPLTINLTFITVRVLDAVQLEVRFCGCRRKTDDGKCGQSREKSGCFGWSSHIALSLSVNESCRTDSTPAIACATELHKATKCFSAVEYVLSVCSVRGGRAVAGRIQRVSLSKHRLWRVRQLSFHNPCKHKQRHLLGDASGDKRGCFAGGRN
jgi:hypothetical protein